MKVYISVDMEGIAGVNHPGPTGSGHARYPAAVELMVGETNAAIEGALAGGADDILVNDSHGGMFNLLPAALHPAARVLQGQKAWSMVEGAGPDAGFDVALFVGYHARAGHPRGTIAHTYSLAPGRDPPGRPADRRVRPQRDDPRGVGHPGRPGRRRRRPGRGGRRLAAVGRAGRGQDGGRRQRGGVGPPDRRRGPDPGRVRNARSGAAAAGGLELLRVGPPVVIEVDYSRGVEADHAAIVPGAERFGDRGVRFASDDPAARLSRLPGRQPAGVDRRSVTRRVDASPAARAAGHTARDARQRSGRAADEVHVPRRCPDGPHDADWPLDRLVAQADALAGAWGARARASTTVGQERAILRLFGVTGLDAAGRPLAGTTVDRWLSADPRALGNGIALPFAMALLEYDLEPQQLALDIASGAIDLALESELLREHDRRAVAEAEAQRLAARRHRADRRPADGPARDHRDARRGRPAVARGHPARAGRRDRPRRGDQPDRRRDRPDPGRGPDRARAGGPADRRRPRRAAVAAARARRAPGTRARRAGPDRQPAGARPPARRADRAAARRRAYVRLATVTPALGAPEGAVVAAFERIDVHHLGRDGRDRRRTRSSPTGRSPTTPSPTGSPGGPARRSSSARAAGRRAGPVVRGAVRPGDARRPGARAPAAGRHPGPRRRPARRPDHRRARCRPG